MKSIIKLLLGYLFIFYLLYPQLTLADIDCGTDSTLLTMRLQPVDTTGLVIIFLVSGWDPTGCRYDSTNYYTSFRNIRREMPMYAQNLADSTYQLSVPNYYDLQSNFKHHIKAAVIPTGDSAYACTDLPPRYAVPDDINTALDSADCDIDFSLFDLTGPSHEPDSVVDCVCFVILNQDETGGCSPAGGFPYGYHYVTSDTDTLGRTIIIDPYYTFLVYSWNYIDEHPELEPECPDVDASYRRLSGLVNHEYGHMLNLPDPDHNGPYYDHYFAGHFCGMTGGFEDRTSPFNPYFRDIIIGWNSSVEVKYIPQYNYLFELDTFSDSSSILMHNPTVSSTQKFFISAYNSEDEDCNTFQRSWPTPDSGGILAWHYDPSVGYRYRQHKRLDIEVALGLYDWTFSPDTTMNTNSPNTSMGLDSLDVRGVYNSSHYLGQCGSENAFFNGYNYNKFDYATNPSSHFYKSASVDSQVVESHLALRNITCTNGSIKADLLVNHWYDSLTANTTWGSLTQETGYALTGDFIIPAGDTLTIRKGTKIYFQADEDDKSSGASSTRCELIVYGTLIAEGDSAHHISFIPSSDQLGTAGPYDWYGIRFMSGSHGNLEYCDINYARYGIYMYTNSIVDIDECSFEDCYTGGIYNYKGVLTADNSSFDDIGSYGITSYYAQSDIDSSNFSDCASYGVVVTNAPNDSLDGTTITNCNIRTGESYIIIGSQYGIKASSIDDIIIRANTVRTYEQGGIYLSASDGVVRKNAVRLCGSYGIYSYNSSPDIDSCVFDSIHTAIYFYLNSTATVNYCKVDSAHTGIYINGSYPTPDFGDTSLADGINDLEYCTNYIIYQKADSPPLIKAEMNYYGRGSFASKMSGNIDYIPYLYSDPFPKLFYVDGLPENYTLQPNFPNPFNPTTMINYSLANSGYTIIEIYNVLGQRITSLVNEYQDAGEHAVMWNGCNVSGRMVSSGVYFYRIASGDFVDTKKMLLLR